MRAKIANYIRELEAEELRHKKLLIQAKKVNKDIAALQLSVRISDLRTRIRELGNLLND